MTVLTFSLNLPVSTVAPGPVTFILSLLCAYTVFDKRLSIIRLLV